jgi:hypothetical protein
MSNLSLTDDNKLTINIMHIIYILKFHILFQVQSPLCLLAFIFLHIWIHFVCSVLAITFYVIYTRVQRCMYSIQKPKGSQRCVRFYITIWSSYVGYALLWEHEGQSWQHQFPSDHWSWPTWALSIPTWLAEQQLTLKNVQQKLFYSLFTRFAYELVLSDTGNPVRHIWVTDVIFLGCSSYSTVMGSRNMSGWYSCLLVVDFLKNKPLVARWDDQIDALCQATWRACCWARGRRWGWPTAGRTCCSARWPTPRESWPPTCTTAWAGSPLPFFPLGTFFTRCQLAGWQNLNQVSYGLYIL